MRNQSRKFCANATRILERIAEHTLQDLVCLSTPSSTFVYIFSQLYGLMQSVEHSRVRFSGYAGLEPIVVYMSSWPF